MAVPRPVKVRCPSCDQQVEVAPRITSVTTTGSTVQVKVDAAPVPHHCGPPPAPVGFSGTRP